MALLGAAIAYGASPHHARAGEASKTVTVEAGKSRTIRLNSVPKDTVMSVAVQSNGKLSLSLLDAGDYRTFPEVRDPLLVGAVDPTLSFTVNIPAAGDYYLVLDNRKSAEGRIVKFALRANRGRGPAASVTPDPARPDASRPGTGTTARPPDRM